MQYVQSVEHRLEQSGKVSWDRDQYLQGFCMLVATKSGVQDKST